MLRLSLACALLPLAAALRERREVVLEAGVSQSRSVLTSIRRALAPLPALPEVGDEESDGEPVLTLDDAEEAKRQAWRLTQGLFNSTRQRCSTDHSWKQIPDLHAICKEEDSHVLLKLLRKAADSPQVAKWLCTAVASVGTKNASLVLPEQCAKKGRLFLNATAALVDSGSKTTWEPVAMFFLACVQLAGELLPLPPPLGPLVSAAADYLMQRLSEKAEKELDDLEAKMDELASRRVSEELFRLGSARARAADEQIKDMSLLDGLWSKSLASPSAAADPHLSELVQTVSRVTSFNRWAIIEQDLATSAEILRPSETVPLMERGKYAELLRTHLQMYLLVLARMYRSAEDTGQAGEMHKALSSKARRMANLLLPDLLLMTLVSEPGRGGLQHLHELFKSPLLMDSTQTALREGCGELANEDNYEFEYLAACALLPLQSKKGYAAPLPAPLTAGDAMMYFFFTAETEDTEVILGLSPKCKPGQHLLSYRRFTQMTQFNLYAETTVRSACGQVPHVHLIPNSRFTTPGLCTDHATLFMEHVVAVVTSLTFESTNSRPGALMESTCQLAYAHSPHPYRLPGYGAGNATFIEAQNSPARVVAHGNHLFRAALLSSGEIRVRVFKRTGELAYSTMLPKSKCRNMNGCESLQFPRIFVKQNHLFVLANGAVKKAPLRFVRQGLKIGCGSECSWLSMEGFHIALPRELHIQQEIALTDANDFTIQNGRLYTVSYASGKPLWSQVSVFSSLTMQTLSQRTLALGREPAWQQASSLLVHHGHLIIASAFQLHLVSAVADSLAPIKTIGFGDTEQAERIPELLGCNSGVALVAWTSVADDADTKIRLQPMDPATQMPPRWLEEVTGPGVGLRTRPRPALGFGQIFYAKGEEVVSLDLGLGAETKVDLLPGSQAVSMHPWGDGVFVLIARS